MSFQQDLRWRYITGFVLCSGELLMETFSIGMETSKIYCAAFTDRLHIFGPTWKLNWDILKLNYGLSWGPTKYIWLCVRNITHRYRWSWHQFHENNRKFKLFLRSMETTQTYIYSSAELELNRLNWSIEVYFLFMAAHQFNFDVTTCYLPVVRLSEFHYRITHLKWRRNKN